MKKCFNCETPDVLDDHGHCPLCRSMGNKSMARKIRKGEAIDLKNCQRTPEGDYILNHHEDDKDYCDSRTEEWIWSIGVTEPPHRRILASTTTKFYQREGVHCLFLR